MHKGINTVDTGIFDIGWRMASIRYGIVAFISFSFSHIFTQQFPFEADYQFPFKSFFILLGIGFIVCSGSWAVTLIYRNRIFSDDTLTLKRVLKFIGVNFVAVSLLYTGIQFLVFQRFSGSGFAIGLFVIGLLAVIENLSFLLVSSSQSRKSTVSSMIIPSGKKKLKIRFDEMAFFRLKDGIIYLHKTDGRRIPTGLSSMDGVEEYLPKAMFFRANRQYIVSREAITELMRLNNRKLQITINSIVPLEHLTISRYKNKEFSQWYLKD